MHSRDRDDEAKLALDFNPEDEMLILRVTNVGNKPVRLWNQDNSWGWEMPRLVLSSESNDRYAHLCPGMRLWTRNFPSFTQLNALEEKSYRLCANDFDPKQLASAREFISQKLLVKAQLHAAKSPEQLEQGVWYGLLESSPQLIEPPHRWLRDTSEVNS